jgi:hypothetical protein
MILHDSLLLTTARLVMRVPLAMLVGRVLASSLSGAKPLDLVGGETGDRQNVIQRRSRPEFKQTRNWS